MDSLSMKLKVISFPLLDKADFVMKTEDGIKQERFLKIKKLNNFMKKLASVCDKKSNQKHLNYFTFFLPSFF